MTILETIRPTAEFGELARKWRRDASIRMLTWVWEGYDLLFRDVLSVTDWTKPADDLERELSELLAARIKECMPTYSPMYLQHESKERETRCPSPAQPPEYDLAFVCWENERVKWPLEAKVLATDGQVAAYVRDIKADYRAQLRRIGHTPPVGPFIPVGSRFVP